MAADHDKMCEELVEKCKHEAKQLAEFTATRRKVHWTHPSFVSFCVSVEDILSYEVKKKYQYYRSRTVTPSGRILQDVGKVLPDAAAIYEKCFSDSSMEREDYYYVHVISMAEKKVLWIRAALIEGKLQGIVECIMNSPRLYYTKQSVPCHQVYGEIFKYLIDGPCSIRFSRLKMSDVAMGTPSPAEIVERHNQVLSLSSIRGQQEDGRSEGIATEAAWEHVRSLYQSTSSTCLFGKNNIMVQPAGFSEPLAGYLTLQQGGTSVMLKWIPNSLLQDSTNAHISLWKTVMSIDIVMQTAHIHCHRTPGQSAELILIGYDGIAHPPLLFPHQPSFFLFLECLENSLLPQGCLEPPLWYIKDKTSKAKSSTPKKKGFNHRHSPKKEEEDEGEWFEAIEVWNQVFRIRYGPRPKKEEQPADEPEKILATPPAQALALNLTTLGSSYESSESGQSDSEDDSMHMVTVEKPGSLARGDWEKFQSKVSRQLLARYFYSWLSHCRHMSKVRANVSHLVGSTALCPSDHTHSGSTSLSEEDWAKFLRSQGDESAAQSSWRAVMKHIYLRGVEHRMRKEVWPYLLGVYPVNSSQEEREAILTRSTEQYQKILSQWQQVEATKKEIELQAACNGHRVGSISSREGSPTLSIVSTSPVLSPEDACDKSHDLSHDGVHSGSHDRSLDGSHDRSLGRSRGGSHERSHDRSRGGSHERSHDRPLGESLDRSRGGSHERSHERLRDASNGTSHDWSCDSYLANGSSHDVAESNDLLHAETETDKRSLGVEIVVSHDQDQQSHDETQLSRDTTHLTPDESSLANGHMSDEGEELEGSTTLSDIFPPDPEEVVMGSARLDSQGREFVKNLYNIDKDIPRCDRDYKYFQVESNLQKVRNMVCSFVWTHLSEGYSQGMCDLLSPLLVVLDSEPLAYACYLKLMEVAIKLFPPNTLMNTRLANIQALLQVMESDFYQYLSDRPMGDGLFYAYRWLLVTFKREFSYDDVFRLWETIWVSRMSDVTNNFEEFFALAIMKQFKTAIMDAHLDPSDILNLFTDLAEKQAMDVDATIRIAQETIQALQSDLARKDC